MNRLTFPHLEYMNSCEKICPAYRICYLFSVMIWQTPVSWKDLGYYFWFIILWQRKQKYNFHRYFPLKSSSIPFPSSSISCFNYWKFVLLEFHWCIQTVSIKSTPQSLPCNFFQSPATSPFWHHGFCFSLMSRCPTGSANIHCRHSGIPWHNGNPLSTDLLQQS